MELNRRQDFVLLSSEMPSVPLRYRSDKSLRKNNALLRDLMDLRSISKPNFHKKTCHTQSPD